MPKKDNANNQLNKIKKKLKGKRENNKKSNKNNTGVSDGVNTSVNDNTTSNTTRTNADITIKRRGKENHSNYRENLYLSKEIQNKLNTISKQTSYSKSELARLAFKYLFDNLKIE